MLVISDIYIFMFMYKATPCQIVVANKYEDKLIGIKYSYITQ